MRVCLVAHDFAPSAAFEKLATVIHGEVVTFLGHGKSISASIEEIQKEVLVSNIILIGMSSSKELAEAEIAASETAMKANIPFGYYGDIYHCHERARSGAWFAPFREHASFFFAINEVEARDAKRIFPNAECVATGNPLWEDFSFPKLTREEARAKLFILADETFILAPGGKSPIVNVLVWGALIDAVSQICDKRFTIILAPHPGDRTLFATDPDTSTNLNIYGDLIKFSSIPVKILDRNIKTSEVLPGADIVVEWGTSICIEAAHLRIPALTVTSEVGRNRLYSFSKVRESEPTKLGISREVTTDPAEIKNAIKMILNDGNALFEIHARQIEVYPGVSTKGEAVKKMAVILILTHVLTHILTHKRL